MATCCRGSLGARVNQSVYLSPAAPGSSNGWNQSGLPSGGPPKMKAIKVTTHNEALQQPKTTQS